jgi:hypothetical protein
MTTMTEIQKAVRSLPEDYSAHRNGPAYAHPNGPSVWLDKRMSVG